jgi:site-specific DNA-methyltransferase (adenine-specific)
MQSYSVLLADPPWRIRHYGPHNFKKSADRYYKTMTSEQIGALPVNSLADRDAALFLWATMPCLPQAMSVIEAWGFRYITAAFTWVKTTADGKPFIGMGAYTRSNPEICLLGLRGKPLERKAHDVQQILLSPRREHSRKPDEQYDRIMRLFDGPYLELFARQRWPGWDVWGNQADLFPAQTFLIPEHEVVS